MNGERSHQPGADTDDNGFKIAPPVSLHAHLLGVISLTLTKPDSDDDEEFESQYQERTDNSSRRHEDDNLGGQVSQEETDALQTMQERRDRQKERLEALLEEQRNLSAQLKVVKAVSQIDGSLDKYKGKMTTFGIDEAQRVVKVGAAVTKSIKDMADRIGEVKTEENDKLES